MIFDFLSDNGIDFQRIDHTAVFTCDEAERIDSSFPGAKTKNLFLRDGKGKRHFIVTVPQDKRVDLDQLKNTLGVAKLGFASAERMEKYLGVTPGSVTLLAVVNDKVGAVSVYIDRAIWSEGIVQCHPLINTSTVAISTAGLLKFFELTGHMANIVDVPGADVTGSAT